jgi:thioredoxin
MKEYTDSNFETFIAGKSCLVKFGAEWCAPCKTVKPVLENVAADTGVDVYEIDIDSHGAVASLLGIRGVPTVIAFKDGTPVAQLVGAYDEESYKELAEKVQE